MNTLTRLDALLIAVLAIIAALLLMGQISVAELADKGLEIVLTATLTARGIIK